MKYSVTIVGFVISFLLLYLMHRIVSSSEGPTSSRLTDALTSLTNKWIILMNLFFFLMIRSVSDESWVVLVSERTDLLNQFSEYSYLICLSEYGFVLS